MTSTKSVVLLLCFLFAVSLLITAEVSAVEVQKVEEQGYGRGGGGYGHGGGYGRGGGYGHGGGYGRGGGGYGRGGYGRGGHCHYPHCKDAETNNEVAAEVDANTHA